jgi:hypothetical protein
VAVVVVVAALWAMSTPGGISARFDDVWTNVSGVVEKAAADPELRRATVVFNEWYEQSGSYPRYTETELRERPEATWGVGLDVQWCGPHYVVLRSPTSRGTISRLLVEGKEHADVTGVAMCPPDLAHLAPWPAL